MEIGNVGLSEIFSSASNLGNWRLEILKLKINIYIICVIGDYIYKSIITYKCVFVYEATKCPYINSHQLVEDGKREPGRCREQPIHFIIYYRYCKISVLYLAITSPTTSQLKVSEKKLSHHEPCPMLRTKPLNSIRSRSLPHVPGERYETKSRL